MLHNLDLPTVRGRRADLDGQLLAKFSAERVGNAFPWLHLAAGEFPRACVRFSRGAGVEEKPAVRLQQDADDDRDGGV